MTSIAIAAALLLAPALIGWLMGLAVRRAGRARKSGVVWPAALLALVVGMAIALDAYVPVVGIWDVITVAGMLVAGLLAALHTAWSDPRNVGLSIVTVALACLLLEPLCRSLLPQAPAFPSQSAPTLFIGQALRASEAEQLSTTRSHEAACTALYNRAPSRWDPWFPRAQDFRPRDDVRLRVLHVGDSILFGSDSQGRFTRDLAQLEPDVEHVNSGICATATDVQLAIVRRWIRTHPIDAVVIHLNPNDSGEIDRPLPCSDWKSLMVYDSGVPQLRFATAHTPDPSDLRLRRLLEYSPPPYLLRAAVPFSVAAAHLAAAFVHLGRWLAFAYDSTPQQGLGHVRDCLGAMHAELTARQIPLVANILHWQQAVQERRPDNTDMKAIAEALGIVTVDSWQPLIDALDRGEQPFLDPGGHLNLAGNAIMAKWLHEQLPPAFERARSPSRPRAKDQGHGEQTE